MVELIPGIKLYGYLFLVETETEMYAMRSVLMNTRKDYNPSLVKPMYSFTLYEKLKRVTITLEENEHPILFASFETLTESFLASINLLHSKELPFDI